MIRKIFLTGAMIFALTLPASAVDLSNMSAEEEQAFRSAVRAYLLENPEVIMEAVAVLEERQQVAETERDLKLVEVNEAALFDDGFSYVGGNPDGDITLVEFLDYRCGYCKRAHPDVAELVAADGNIRLIVKEFPILGEQSTLASQFAIATMQLAGPESYKLVSDALMTMRGNVDAESLRRIADEFGLEGEAILAHMNSEEVAAVMAETRLLGQRLQITGTPTFILAGQMLRGYVPLDGMQKIVAEARSEG